MLSRVFRTESETIAARRKRQIDTLKIFNDKVTEIQEDVEYHVEFTAGNYNMAMLVSLSPDFPLEKPVLKIMPPIIHPWVNQESEITEAPGYLNFTVHSDLGRVVQAIIRELERRPPMLKSEYTGSNTANMTALQPLVNGTTSPTYGLPVFDFDMPSTSCRPSYPDIGCNPQSPQLRTQSATFPELSKLTVAELQKLNESEDRLNDFVAELPAVKQMDKHVDDLMTQIEELANHNLSKQSMLESQRERVLEKYDHVQTLKKSYESASQEYQRLSDLYSPDNIKESLRLAALRCDEESEKLAERFLNKETNVETFLERYVDRRMLSHTRKTKEEKLTKQLHEFHRAGY